MSEQERIEQILHALAVAVSVESSWDKVQRWNIEQNGRRSRDVDRILETVASLKSKRPVPRHGTGKDSHAR